MLNFYISFYPLALMGLIANISFGNTASFLVTLALTILYSGYGVSVGFHRLHSHRSFKTWEPVRKALLYLGCQAAQGSPVTWALIHLRSHHRYTDTERDLHSPVHGIFHALGAWIFKKSSYGFAQKELFKVRKTVDKFSMMLHKNYFKVVYGNALIFGLLSYPFMGFLGLASTLSASMMAVIISGYVNWIGHGGRSIFNYRNYDTNDQSVNNPWLSLFTWGESLHNNHHGNAVNPSFSTNKKELDPGIWMINLIRKL